MGLGVAPKGHGHNMKVLHVGGCQNYGPFLGTLNIRCRIMIGTQKGTINLTTTHVCPEIGGTLMQPEAQFQGPCKESALGRSPTQQGVPQRTVVGIIRPYYVLLKLHIEVLFLYGGLT